MSSRWAPRGYRQRGAKIMKLFHFVNQKYGLTAIGDRRLKVSRFTELNDPFEMLGVSLSSKRARRFMRAVKEETGRSIGLLCFSEVWQNPLMWSHYAALRSARLTSQSFATPAR